MEIKSLSDLLQKSSRDWIWILGYEGLYKVSRYGDVLSVNRVVKKNNGRMQTVHERLKNQVVDEQGYKTVSLYKDGMEKIVGTHRVVLSSFRPVDNMENLQVNHIDGNPSNNCLSNLEWVTPSENIQHAIELGRVNNRPKDFYVEMGKKGAESRRNGLNKIADPTLYTKSQGNRQHYSQPVKCLENGITYASRTAASRELNISDSSIVDSLRDGRKHAGYTFIEVDR